MFSALIYGYQNFTSILVITKIALGVNPNAMLLANSLLCGLVSVFSIFLVTICILVVGAIVFYSVGSVICSSLC